VTETAPPADAPASDGDTPRRSSTVLVAVLSVLLVLLRAAALVGALQLREAKQRDDARAAALVAARQEALNLTSIDGRDIDADLKRVLDDATGGFKADFAQRSKDLKTVLTENQVVAEGKVLEAALVRSDTQTATALVVVDSNVKNKAAPQGRSNTYRMQLDLEKHGNRWLTSALQFVG
jgi:Mce-associated membrane protein